MPGVTFFKKRSYHTTYALAGFDIRNVILTDPSGIMCQLQGLGDSKVIFG
jgi:hypothetical protein